MLLIPAENMLEQHLMFSKPKRVKTRRTLFSGKTCFKTCYIMPRFFPPKRVKTRRVFPAKTCCQTCYNTLSFFPPKPVKTRRSLEPVKQEQQQEEQQQQRKSRS